MRTIPNEHFFAWVEESLSVNRSVRFCVRGVSMFPLLRDGRDEVTVQRIAPERLKRGDILLFRYRGRHLLHRVVKRDGDRLLLRGDNTYGGEEHCRTEEVVGIVTCIHRRKSSGYMTVPPRSWRWNAIARLWRIRCRCYRLLAALKKALSR